MRIYKKNPLFRIVIFLIVIGFLFNALPTDAGDFGSGSTFSSSEVEKNFNLPTTEQHGETGYFIHSQLIKLILFLIFIGVALIVLVTTRYKYRKAILFASVAILGLYIDGFLCPSTAIQNIFLKWQTGYLFLFLTIVVSTLLYGRIFCGYICPFGAIQELVHFKRISQKIPYTWNRYLAKVKYIVLGYLVVRVLITGQVILKDYTPFKVLFTWGGTPLSIILTLMLVVLSIIIYRPFCRYLCPLGAFLALLSRVSLFKVKIGSICVNCGLCKNVCKVGAISGTSLKIDSSKCIVCGDCVRKCPKKAISHTFTQTIVDSVNPTSTKMKVLR